jgi:hypothetical protein
VSRLRLLPLGLVLLLGVSLPGLAEDFGQVLECAPAPGRCLNPFVDGVLPRECGGAPPVYRLSGEATPAGAPDNLKLHACSAEVQRDPLRDFFASSCSCQQAKGGTLERLRVAEAATADQARKNDAAHEDAIVKSPELKAELALRKELICSDCLASLPGETITSQDFISCKSRNKAVLPDSGLMLLGDSDAERMASILRSRGWSPPEPPERSEVFRLSLPKFAREPIPRSHFESFCSDPAADFQSASSALEAIRFGFMTGKVKPPSPFLSLNHRDVLSKISGDYISKELYTRITKEKEAAVSELFRADQRAKVNLAFEAARAQALKTATRLYDPGKIACPQAPLPPSLACESKRTRAQTTLDRALTALKNVKWKPDNDLESGEGSGASYHGKENEVRISGTWARMITTDPEALQFVILHELGHGVKQAADSSVAPFERVEIDLRPVTILGRPPPPEPEWKKVPLPGNSIESCLRSANSVGASSLQLGEAFADYFATESMVKLMEPGGLTRTRVSKLGLALCEGGYPDNHPDAAKDEHPTSPARLNRIIAVHPAVRRTLGQPPLPADGSPKYCSEF